MRTSASLFLLSSVSTKWTSSAYRIDGMRNGGVLILARMEDNVSQVRTAHSPLSAYGIYPVLVKMASAKEGLFDSERKSDCKVKCKR